MQKTMNPSTEKVKKKEEGKLLFGVLVSEMALT
jgi:hypothetical protein